MQAKKRSEGILRRAFFEEQQLGYLFASCAVFVLIRVLIAMLLGVSFPNVSLVSSSGNGGTEILRLFEWSAQIGICIFSGCFSASSPVSARNDTGAMGGGFQKKFLYFCGLLKNVAQSVICRFFCIVR